jgi:hypothetical protein
VRTCSDGRTYPLPFDGGKDARGWPPHCSLGTERAKMGGCPVIEGDLRKRGQER